MCVPSCNVILLQNGMYLRNGPGVWEVGDGSALGHGDHIDGCPLGHRGGDRAPTTSPTIRSVNGDRADFMDGRT